MLPPSSAHCISIFKNSKNGQTYRLFLEQMILDYLAFGVDFIDERRGHDARVDPGPEEV